MKVVLNIVGIENKEVIVPLGDGILDENEAYECAKEVVLMIKDNDIELIRIEK